MKLTVPTPSTWSVDHVDDGDVLRAPDGSIEIRVLGVGGIQLVLTHWLYGCLIRDQPAGTEATNLSNGELSTTSGWRGLTCEATVGELRRLVAYYTVLDYSATIIATWNENNPAARDEVIRLLSRAFPDFLSSRTQIWGIAELLHRPPPLAPTPPAKTVLGKQWRRVFSAGDVVLIPHHDPDAGWIRISSKQAPLRSVRELFATFPTPPEVGVTEEGEYFALGVTRSLRKQQMLAIVFGAESYTRIEANTLNPARFDFFVDAGRELAHRTILGYGSQRIRPFYYVPPPAWVPMPRTSSTMWVSPTCSRRYHVMRVFDARPVWREGITREWRFESLPAEFLSQPARGPATYYRKDGLECRAFAYTAKYKDGGELRVLDGSMIDEHYVYPIRIECDPGLADLSMFLFEALASTIVPLPPPPLVQPRETALFTHWAE